MTLAPSPDIPLPYANHFFLARQPILNRSQRLVAYELLYRNADSGVADFTNGTAATASVIAHASELGMEQVVGEQLAYVNVDTEGLMSDFIRFLPNDKVILEVLETVDATPAVLARVAELKQAGFKFALDDVVGTSDSLAKLQPLMDVIKIDIKQMAPDTLAELTRTLKNPRQKLLAEKVETQEEFRHCLDLGFEYFQGYYFARPVILSGKKIAPSQMAIMHLLDLLASDADQRDIERGIKLDPLITLNLLRLVNTPAVGARFKINSVGHALIVLGRRQLQRWLQILLYVKGQQYDSPLLQLATTRGKTMENLLEHVRPGRADIGFTVGIMSLMDTLFSVPMGEILDSVNVLDDVRAALLHREGDYGNVLRLIELIEVAREGPELTTLLHELNIAPSTLYASQLAAYEWVNEYTHGVTAPQR
ncbi:EAL and modified HD-GYP domain-containing signal transduction protein [Pseudoduganella flava]|uniref:EAL and modified HD-GYP domain-containing signal transduction protein n=1 Tax=Pseudoduganella flava TaxID=871742 RepID=A0A562PZZ2_9BURK|nr:EAL domain-containing protein [Pseudoduganella flava]QGZ38665.1 EAL domain-containing protein [Pseudoduganella flava]TWI49760.1 EAL and modified HD-GYP domain-containing signal transduction protein [Pseudoduganella flava]